MKKFPIALLLCALFATSGCALPQVELKSALLKGLSTTRLDVALNLNIFNPNEYSLPLQAVEWDLSLFEAPFTDGVASFSTNIPAQERADVEVPLGIQFQSLAIGVESLLTRQQIPWKFAGACSFRTPRGPVKAGYGLDGSWTNPLFN